MNSTAAITAPTEKRRIHALLIRPIGWPTFALSTVLAAWTVWGFSFPGGPSMDTYASLVLAWLTVGSYWFVRLLVCSAIGKLRPILDAWRRWAAPLAVALVTAALLATSVPLLVRFNLSQGEMDQLAHNAVSGVGVKGTDSVGLFPIERVETFQGGVRFIVNDCMADTCGFAYSPERRPPNLGGEDSYLYLEGGWYLWEESW
jgi:hypothetical protein